MFLQLNADPASKRALASNKNEAVAKLEGEYPHGRAAHRFSAIRMRSLNDPHRGLLLTVRTVTPTTRHLQAKTDGSVTIRPGIPTRAQRVSRIGAETDVLQR